MRHSLKLGRSFIYTEGAEIYNVPKSTIIDKTTVSIQQRFSQNQRELCAVPAKTNVMVLIPGKIRMFVLAGISLFWKKLDMWSSRVWSRSMKIAVKFDGAGQLVIYIFIRCCFPTVLCSLLRLSLYIVKVTKYQIHKTQELLLEIHKVLMRASNILVYPI